MMMDEDGETAGFAILSFTGSKLKKLRKFMTSFKMLRGRPKLFQIMARVKTEKEKNDLGTFYNYAMTIEKTLTKEHDAAKIGEGYEFAKRVRDMDYADPEPDTQPDMAEPKKELVDDEIPF